MHEYDRHQINILKLKPTAALGVQSLSLTDPTSTLAINFTITSNVAQSLANLEKSIGTATAGKYLATAADGYLLLRAVDPTVDFTVTEGAALVSIQHVDNLSDSNAANTQIFYRNNWTIDPLGHVTLTHSGHEYYGGGHLLISTENLTKFDDNTYAITYTGTPGRMLAGYAPAGFTPDDLFFTETVAIDQLGHAKESFFDSRGRLTDVFLSEVDYTNTDPNATVTSAPNSKGQPHWR